jgi:uncharacterized protein YbbK (DUF523 family)
MEKIPIGISSCLLGHNVRYDGGHRCNACIIETLGCYFDFQPCCPEVGIGLGVPRTPIFLVKKDNEIRCVDTKNPKKDLTNSLRDYARQQKQAYQNLCGYILKSGSPSCGMGKVKVYVNSTLRREGIGIYAEEMMRINPLFPVEEEARLNDSAFRENFIQRVRILFCWKKMLSEGLSVDHLIQFHDRHKHILISRGNYRELEQMLEAVGQNDIEQTAGQYILLLMTILKEEDARTHL